MQNGLFFVTRLKRNADVEYLLKLAGRKRKGITEDQQIQLKAIKKPLQLAGYADPETDNHYSYVTNAHHLKDAEVTDIYKEC